MALVVWRMVLGGGMEGGQGVQAADSEKFKSRWRGRRCCSPNIYKEPRKTTVPYCTTAPFLCPLTPYRSLMLGPVWTFPHGLPYCFRSFHATTRSKFRWFFSCHKKKNNKKRNGSLCMLDPKDCLPVCFANILPKLGST